MKPALLIALVAGFAAAAEPSPLKKAEGEAREKVAQSHEARVKRRKSLERLQKDLRYISEELDRDTLTQGKDLSYYSLGALARLKHLRVSGNLDPRLEPSLSRLEELYRDLPKKTYAEEYAGSLSKAIGRELRWIADGTVEHAHGDHKFADKGEEAADPRDEATILALLDANLSIPDSAPDDSGKALALFPVNLPLHKFRKLGPIRIFLVKHRISKPKGGYVQTTPEAIVERKHNVQIGVEVSGLVNYQSYAVDQDYTFNIGDVHIEITPEWRLLYKVKHGREIVLPKVGDKVKVQGWSYFDIFHKSEGEYDPGDEVMGVNRFTQWEIHPVNEIERLP